MTGKTGGDFGVRVWGCDDSFSQWFIKFGYEAKNDYVFGSVCHSNEKHSSFETGDHLKTFGAALEPAPQGFEENEKVREPLGETAIQWGGPV